MHKSPAPLLADIDLLKPDIGLIIPDQSYTTPLAIRMDAAYQGLIKGVIPTEKNCIIQSDIQEITSIEDNYRFVKKYFALHWYVYILLIRLLTLNNPIKEVWYFFKLLSVVRVNLLIDNLKEKQYTPFLNDSPLISVVIPTLNRYEYLKVVLSDLENQDYKNFEVLICDQSDDFSEEFYANWNINIRVFRQVEKALWLARNTCIVEAKGTYIALTEDDVRLNSGWISAHLFCIKKFGADASCGIFFSEGGSPLASQLHFKLSEQFATGNSLIKKEVFSQIGLFDRQFEKQRMGDGEFGLRCILSGFILIQNPQAYCVDLKAPTGGLREFGLWDAFGRKGIFSPLPVPSTLYFSRKYFGNKSSLYWLLINVPRAFLPYRFKNNKVMKISFFIMTPLLLPMILIKNFRSWQIATKMLTFGAKISL